jgi:hypothetical protein
MNKRNKIMAAFTAALAAGSIGVGVTTAYAAPPTAPPSAADTPEPGDTPDAPGAADNDNVQQGDQNGPEIPDSPGN